MWSPKEIQVEYSLLILALFWSPPDNVGNITLSAVCCWELFFLKEELPA